MHTKERYIDWSNVL